MIIDTHNTLHIRWQHVEAWGQHNPQRVTASSPKTLHLSAHTQCWEWATIHQILALIILNCRWLHGTNFWVHRSVNEPDQLYHAIYCKVFLNLHTSKTALPKSWFTQYLSLHLICLFSFPFSIFSLFCLFMFCPSFHLKVLLGEGLLRSLTLS